MCPLQAVETPRRGHRGIQEAFQRLGRSEAPGTSLLLAANHAIADIAHKFRSRLAEAIWFENEIESLVRAGNQIRFASFFGKMRGGAS